MSAPAPALPGGGVTPEPVQGNSLDQILRSLTNFLGGAGTSTTGTGGDILAGGGSTVQGALSGMAGPLDYWSKLLTGDSKTTSEALAPTAATISKQFGAAERGVDTGAVRGGMRSGQLAELPFTQAAQVGTAGENLQGDAAKNIISTLSGIAGIGTAQEGVGLGEQGIGLQQLLGSLNALMQRRGQNVAQDTANIGAIGSGLGDLLGGLIGSLNIGPFKTGS